MPQHRDYTQVRSAYVEVGTSNVELGGRAAKQERCLLLFAFDSMSDEEWSLSLQVTS